MMRFKLLRVTTRGTGSFGAPSRFASYNLYVYCTACSCWLKVGPLLNNRRLRCNPVWLGSLILSQEKCCLQSSVTWTAEELVLSQTITNIDSVQSNWKLQFLCLQEN